MKKETLIVKTNPLPQSRIAVKLEIPSETCKLCINETINTLSRSAKIPGLDLANSKASVNSKN